MTIKTFAKQHPIQSVVFSVFALFALFGGGYGAVVTVSPYVVNADIIGPPCCGDGGIIINNPDPTIIPGFPGFPPGGGGGGGIPTPQPPICESFSANPNSITTGGTATLTWDTTRVVSATINQGIGSVAVDGTRSVSPTSTTTYVLTGTSSTGATVTCDTTVTVTTINTNPVCEAFTVADVNITRGESVNLTWETSGGTSVVITPGIGSVAATGSQLISPTNTTTYTLTVTDGDGDTDTCQTTVTVHVPNAPQCISFIANPNTLVVGNTATLTWDTENADTVSINNGIGAVAVDGNTTVSPTTTTTYVLTVNGNGTSVNCEVTVTVTTVNGPQCISFTADPSSINEGGSTTLTWDTENADTVSINNGIGAVAADGNTSVSPTDDTTYILTVTGNGETVTCEVAVDVEGNTSTPGPQCDLFTADPSSIRENASTTLTWETTRATSVEIDNGIGAVDDDGSIEVSPNGDTTYTLTVRANGRTDVCTVTVDVDNGGGGGGRRNPRISIDFLPPAPQADLAFVTLSQIPYTGLDLGPVGTIFYWTILIIWSGALAYLVLFKLAPTLTRRTQGVVFSEPEEEPTRPHYTQQGGFASFKSEEKLSVDDIVRGLNGSTPAYPEATEDVDEEYTEDEVQAPVVAPTPAPRGISSDAAMFLNTIMSGDRTSAFGMLRRAGRGEKGTEALIENALVLLDEAYRARIEGSACDKDIERMCAPADTALLEQVIEALASAVDTTYSKAQTGAKMAVTRALAITERQ